MAEAKSSAFDRNGRGDLQSHLRDHLRLPRPLHRKQDIQRPPSAVVKLSEIRQRAAADVQRRQELLMPWDGYS